MGRPLSESRTARVTLFVLLDVVSIGMGMGVPFFTILLGAPTGWVAARRQKAPLREAMRACFRTALWTSGVSLMLLAIIWLPWVPTLWGSDAEVLKSGVPLILYERRASLAGWLVLMVVVSPILQALLTLSASYVVLMRRPPDADADRTRGEAS